MQDAIGPLTRKVNSLGEGFERDCWMQDGESLKRHPSPGFFGEPVFRSGLDRRLVEFWVEDHDALIPYLELLNSSKSFRSHHPLYTVFGTQPEW